jgi:hypothetical protein
MSSNSDWLPPLVLLKDYGDEKQRYLEVVYGFFCQDFVTSRPNFEGKRVGLKRYPLKEGKEVTFWHIIGDNKEEDDHQRRCARIRWPRPIIEAIKSGQIKWWKNKRGKADRIIIALEDFSYVVVLEDRGEYVLPWTAYCVEKPHRQYDLRREYEAFVNNKS